MAAGSSISVTATYQTEMGSDAVRVLVNRATATSSTLDPMPDNNSATALTLVQRVGSICDFNADGRAEIVLGIGRRDREPHVRVVSLPAGGGTVELFEFQAYFDPFPGGVFVACGDVTGDGYPEIVTGADVGGDAHVRAIQVDPVSYAVSELASFYAYALPFPGGVRVAVGDVDGDGIGDIVTGAGASGGPHVEAFSLVGGVHVVSSFYAYAPAFDGGVFVASCDLNGDGQAEILTGVGRRDGGPHVRVIDLAGGVLTELAAFNAYFQPFPGGVFVACGDVTGDGSIEILTGADVGGDAHVRAIGLVDGTLTEMSTFYAYAPPFPGGVRVAAGDVDGDGIAEIITGPGAGGGPLVRIFKRGPNGELSLYMEFYGYAPQFNGGVFVASGMGQ
jgi:hypothetical protein